MAERKINSYERFVTELEKLLDMPVLAARETTGSLQRYVESSLNVNFVDLAYSQLADIAISA